MEVQESIVIQAPPTRVWELLSDPHNVLRWYEPVQAFEYTGDRRSTVGAPFRFEEKVAGRVMKLECVVTEWRDNERFAFEMRSGNMMKSYGETWTVEAVPSGCRFTFAERGEFPALNAVLGPLAGMMSRTTVRKMLARLKTLAEE